MGKLQKKFVIESDGTVKGTKVSIDGHEVNGATSIVFEAHASSKEVDFKIRYFEKETENKKIGF
jgi:hypothetical protein